MYDGKITSITVKNGKAVISYTDNVRVAGMDDFINKELTAKVDKGISDKFSNIMRAFLGHGLIRLGLLCANLDEKAMKSRKCIDMPEFKNFSVQSLKFNGEDENEVAKIVLIWETPEGEKIPLNVPPIKINNGGYVYEALINDDIQNVVHEANLYLEDKNYIGQQIEMFSGGDEEQF